MQALKKTQQTETTSSKNSYWQWFSFKKINNQTVRYLLHWFAAILLMVIFSAFIQATGQAQIQTPDPSYLILDRYENYLAQIKSDKSDEYGYWPIVDWPERVINATLILEDKHFWQHPGVDGKAIIRAIWQNLSNAERISGASTLAMQIARMQNPGSRTYYRKLVESFTAVLLTLRYGREQILKHYLTLVPYGNQIHGISYAANRYFNKPAKDLSWSEIALLSAIPQAPSRHNPLNEKGLVLAKKRAIRIIDELLAAQLIDGAQAEFAEEEIAQFQFSKLPPRAKANLHAILKIKREIKKQKSAGLVLPLTIHSHIDNQLQSYVSKLTRNYLNRWRANGADKASVIVVDLADNQIISWLGSTNYYDDRAGAIDYLETPRSTGSILKPFIFGLALDLGIIRANTVLADLPSESFGTGNSDNRFLGPVLPRKALANSRNIPAVNMVREIGLEKTYQFFYQLGLHQYQETAKHYGANLAIGNLPATVESVAQAYSIFAHDGMLLPLSLIGQTSTSESLLSAPVSRQITGFLSDPVARLPTFPRMGTLEYGFPAAIKTGTSQGYRDSWSVVYSKNYLVTAWAGRSDWGPMRKLGGAASTAQLVQQIMNELHPTNTASLKFEVPAEYQKVSLCSKTGKLASPECQERNEEWLALDQLPDEDTNFKNIIVDSRNGLIAGSWTPESFLIQRQYADFPEKYASWAQKYGFKPSPRVFSALNQTDPNFDATLISKNHLIESVLLEPYLEITSPNDNFSAIISPDIPAHLNTLAFYLKSNKKVDQVLWYVDDKPFKLAAYGKPLRWPLEKGVHYMQAEIPYYNVKSNRIRVSVE